MLVISLMCELFTVIYVSLRFACLDLPSMGGSLSVASGKKAEPQAALADADADLEERLNNLRRD